MKYQQKSFSVGKSDGKLERVFALVDGEWTHMGEEDPWYYTAEEVWEEARLGRLKKDV